MNRDEFKKAFDPALVAFLREQIDIAKAHIKDETIQAALEQMYDMFGERGKRVRPYVLYLMYTSAGGTVRHDWVQAGIASELQHAFALIHDDIIDRGDTRHDIATAHEVMSKGLTTRGVERDVQHLANAQAMLIGDLVLSWSHLALGQLESKYSARTQSLFQDMAVKLIVGEMMDVSFPYRDNVDDEEVTVRDQFKTAADTFVYPMLMGASLAGREEQFASFCKQFGNCMGEVFQIQDDILDVLGGEGKPPFADVREHQHTYLTQYILRSGSERDKKTLQTFFSGKKASSSVQTQVQKLVSNPSVIATAKADSIAKLAEAKQAIHRAGFENSYEQLWLEAVGYFEQRF